MNIILMGPQGSGKGTQAERLLPLLQLKPIATGNLFRAAIAAGTPLGKQAKAILDNGQLVPDDITIGLVEQKLDDLAPLIAKGEAKGALFDGFPRTRAQAESLESSLARRGEEVDAVFWIDVPREQLLERLAGRLVCTRCGQVFHLTMNPPAVAGVCDVCGGVLTQREDDTPLAVSNRLAAFMELTAPLLDYYDQQGRLYRIDGARPIGEVTESIVGLIKTLGSNRQTVP